MKSHKTRMKKLEEGKGGGFYFFAGQFQDDGKAILNEDGEMLFTYKGGTYTQSEVDRFCAMHPDSTVIISDCYELSKV